MNFIKEVKERTNILKVAEYYGLKLDRANKCICPFHKEKSPSFSVSPNKQIFHCFGCGTGGDAISLVSKLLNVNALEAAKSINNTLGLGLDVEKPSSYFEINRYKEKRRIEEKFKEWEIETFKLLCDYLHGITGIEKYQEQDKIEYFIDEIFINGTNEDKIWFWKKQKKVVQRIEERVRTFRTTNK